MALIVAWPNDGRLVATTESPEITIVGDEAAAAGALCARAAEHSEPAATNVAAAGMSRRQMCRGRRGPRRKTVSMNDTPFRGTTTGPHFARTPGNCARRKAPAPLDQGSGCPQHPVKTFASGPCTHRLPIPVLARPPGVHPQAPARSPSVAPTSDQLTMSAAPSERSGRSRSRRLDDSRAGPGPAGRKCRDCRQAASRVGVSAASRGSADCSATGWVRRKAPAATAPPTSSAAK